MDLSTLERTRRSLHAVAELLLAGPQWRQSGDIRLRSAPGGFATVNLPDIRVEGVSLVVESASFALAGTIADVAAAARIEPRSLADVYSDKAELGPDDLLQVDDGAAARLADAFSIGDQALRALGSGEEPVLWPEHFDIAITADEVNYGVSPGDATIKVPYAYVAPWNQRAGEFWNQSFGAARPMHELGDLDAVVNFFARGKVLAAGDS